MDRDRNGRRLSGLAGGALGDGGGAVGGDDGLAGAGGERDAGGSGDKAVAAGEGDPAPAAPPARPAAAEAGAEGNIVVGDLGDVVDSVIVAVDDGAAVVASDRDRPATGSALSARAARSAGCRGRVRAARGSSRLALLWGRDRLCGGLW